MLQEESYSTILRRMLTRVEEWAAEQGIRLDTREGSLIRTALSPAALELQLMYLELQEVMNESFADTQSRDFLIRRCRERGILPEPATWAIRKGEFNLNVPIGARFSLNQLNYAVTEKIEEGVFQLRCETAGTVGNLESGELVPIDYINGLTRAVLLEVLIPGEDEEMTEHLRARYFGSLKSQAFGGNLQDYVEKTLALGGVGGVKVYPHWNGGGTVKLVILDTEFSVPSALLLEAVQTAIDPVPNGGLGMGIAPIGHLVTVLGAGQQQVDISTGLTFEAGWNWAAVEPYVHVAVDQYFRELSAAWDSVDWRSDPRAALTVRISQIETRLLDLKGILDIEGTTLNGQPQNLLLDADAIPVRGAVRNG